MDGFFLALTQHFEFKLLHIFCDIRLVCVNISILNPEPSDSLLNEEEKGQMGEHWIHCFFARPL